MDALEAARAQPVEALLAVLVALATAALAKLLRDRRRVASASAALATAVALEVATAAGASESGGPPVLVAYCTTRGRSRELAERLALALRRAGRGVVLVDAANAHVDVWDELLNGSARDAAVLISTAHQGRVPEGARLLLEDGLDELDKDFRVGRGAFKGRRFAVLGLGSSAYEPKHFCTAAKKAEKLLRRLGAARVASQCLDDTAEDDLNEAVYAKWEQRVVAAFVMPNKFVTPVAVEDDAEIADQESLPSDNEGEEEEDDDEEDDEPQSGVLDLEDIGRTMLKNVPSGLLAEPKEMVTASQAKSLKKEGYKLIGTHSAVKMCRWTKHQLRGRGGCYKHTFYGITSYQCMEATPSLACANKCTFCWRHHKNPVGREWKWKTDEPAMIVAEAVRLHVGMIKETKGIPGVLPERWKQAHTVRHCALSLVGEPIMYPHINDLIGELHDRQISTFLVTNAQFPDAIRTLRPITQLYVSVDAPNKEALEIVDRPLFSDAWERLRESLRLLKAKRQRTVCRLTIVKGHNSGDIDGYADLICLGLPSIVEIKGVTFCGTSEASDLTMDNCPWHHEVVAFAKELNAAINVRTSAMSREKGDDVDDSGISNDAGESDRGPRYAIACSHKHSVSVMLARVDQLADVDPDTGRIVGWNTWIDYDKFHELEREFHRSGATFSVRDYTAPTVDWALMNAEEEGFSPEDTRMYKKKANGKSR